MSLRKEEERTKDPTPLAYFLSGAASCFIMQFALVAMKNDVVLDNFEVTARAHYTLPVGGEFQEIIYDMRVRSNSPTNEILNLVQKAEELCFVHNTFKNTRIRVVTNVILNDRKIR